MAKPPFPAFPLYGVPAFPQRLRWSPAHLPSLQSLQPLDADSLNKGHYGSAGYTTLLSLPSSTTSTTFSSPFSSCSSYGKSVNSVTTNAVDDFVFRRPSVLAVFDSPPIAPKDRNAAPRRLQEIFESPPPIRRHDYAVTERRCDTPTPFAEMDREEGCTCDLATELPRSVINENMINIILSYDSGDTSTSDSAGMLSSTDRSISPTSTSSESSDADSIQSVIIRQRVDQSGRVSNSDISRAERKFVRCRPSEDDSSSESASSDCKLPLSRPAPGMKLSGDKDFSPSTAADRMKSTEHDPHLQERVWKYHLGDVVALLLVSLVPSNNFRQAYRAARSVLMPHKEIVMNAEALEVMHKIFEVLLRLLKRAKLYVDPTVHGTAKLTSYFAVMTYCLVSKTEKLMFSMYFLDLWNLFQPKLSEPAIPVHMNKQALLLFWYHVCTDCPENVKLIIQNPHVIKNIAFNYILADHDDQEVIVFNRCMLPAYYGLLRLCCQQSRPFTRQLANHQNIQWAFKNITPYTTQYNAAVNELFKLMRLFVTKYSDASEQELRDIHLFKRTTLRLYLTVLDARACWSTLINVLRILVETTDDRLFVIYNNGLSMLFQAFYTLHMMYHEATACHVTADMVDLLAIVQDLLKTARANRETLELRQFFSTWKEQPEGMRKILTLLNSYTPPELRQICIEVLQEFVLLYPNESLSTLVPLLASCHATFQESNSPGITGPFFPKRGQKLLNSKQQSRPARPVVQMFLHTNQLECAKGVDEDYDHQLIDFFLPYHQLVDLLCRVAISNECVTTDLVSLSAMLAIEGVPLHLPAFPKLWLDIIQSEVGREFIQLLCNSSYFIDYLESVLLDERTCLNHPIIFQLFSVLLPKVASQVVNDQMLQLVSSLMSSFVKTFDDTDITKQAFKLNGDLRALCLIFSVDRPPEVPKEFIKVMNRLIDSCSQMTKKENCNSTNCKDQEDNQDDEKTENIKNSKAESEPSPTTSSECQPPKRQRLDPHDKEDSSSNGRPLDDKFLHPADICDGYMLRDPSLTPPARWAEILLKSASALVSILQQGNS
ncbi:ubiquitin carboxyl-terminal hydrolase 34-like [Uloborus diversus]|uniref:ubiquitin carboxyl-terminal hydrolase 34-like n=1 Tax=Uloborus diversus TaxID=327109 RepID=UPI00240A8FEC|nr:ubiquitin carboxyl-terminal hydrolase 34-like [Uloborus diversus]